MIFTELKMDKKEEGLLWIVTNRGKEGMYIKEELNELSYSELLNMISIKANILIDDLYKDIAKDKSYSKSIYPIIRRDFNKIFNKLRGGY